MREELACLEKRRVIRRGKWKGSWGGQMSGERCRSDGGGRGAATVQGQCCKVRVGQDGWLKGRSRSQVASVFQLKGKTGAEADLDSRSKCCPERWTPARVAFLTPPRKEK